MNIRQTIEIHPQSSWKDIEILCCLEMHPFASHAPQRAGVFGLGAVGSISMLIIHYSLLTPLPIREEERERRARLVINGLLRNSTQTPLSKCGLSLSFSVCLSLPSSLPPLPPSFAASLIIFESEGFLTGTHIKAFHCVGFK